MEIKKQILQLKTRYRNKHKIFRKCNIKDLEAKKCSAFLVFRKMQNQTTLRFHFTPIIMNISINQMILHASEDIE